ncbi:MAG: hypothetical protein HY814_13015 [Candidatus Riflebacteria bacterium]|nr:hypothetical protein [Candidatus Riflebacteria bacterium]
MRRVFRFLMCGALILAAAGSGLAQGRPGASAEVALVDRLRSTLQSDLAESFPGARLQIRLSDRWVRLNVDVDTPNLSETATLDLLETLQRLAVSDVNLVMPGYSVADDSTFVARSGGRSTSRRMADFRIGATRRSTEPGGEGRSQAAGLEAAPLTPATTGLETRRGPGAGRASAGVTVVIFVPGRKDPAVVRLEGETVADLREGRTLSASADMVDALAISGEDPALQTNLSILASRLTTPMARVLYHQWEGPLPPARGRKTSIAARAEPGIDELLAATEPQEEAPGVSKSWARQRVEARLDQRKLRISGPPPKLKARSRASAASKGKTVEDAARAEQQALELERRALTSLAAGGSAPTTGTSSPADRPWEEMKVPTSAPPPTPRKPFELVPSDLIELPTARTAARDQVLVHGRTVFRDLDSGFYSNVRSAFQRVNEFDFRVGATRRLEAQFRPYFSSVELDPAASASFGSSSADQGAVGLGLRYRLPYHEELFRAAVGMNLSIVKNSDRLFLMPDDFSRLRGLYFAVSYAGDHHNTWHLAASWTPLDVPPGTSENSLWRVGFGLEHRISAELRALGELIYEVLDVETVGRFGKAREPDFLAANVGLRAAFRVATLDLYTRRLGTADFNEVGLAVRTEL